MTRIFEPIQIGKLEAANRIFMAPMTRCRATPEGVHGESTALYYAQRASAGLVISEACAVSRQGSGYPVIPGLFTDEQEASWKKVIEAVHGQGGRIFVQLMHTGRVGHSSLQGEGGLVAPSPIALSGKVMASDLSMKPAEMPRELTEAEIQDVIGQFVQAARRAVRAGADGIELHGANGYLLDQFLRDGSNLRQDSYGGSLQGRLRFLLEMTNAIASEIGRERVAVRLSPFGTFNDMKDSDPRGTFIAAARELGRLQIAFLHVIETVSTDALSLGGRLSPQMRQAFGGTFVANGGYTRELAEAAIASGEADAVSFGVAYIANPDLVRRFRVQAPLNAADRTTFYQGGARGYTDYPVLQEEAFVE